MKLQALAAVLLVFLVCPNANGQLVRRVVVDFSLPSLHNLISRVKDDVNKLEAHVETLEGEAKAYAQHVVSQVKALLEKKAELTLQELIKLLKEVNALALKVDTEVKAYVTKLQQELEIATRELLLKYLTELQKEVTQLQSLTTTLEGQLKTEAQQLLSQLTALLQKGVAITIGEITVIQNKINLLSQKLPQVTAEAFKELYKDLQIVIEAKVQQLLSQIEGYLNQVQAYIVNLEGQAKVRAEQFLNQLKAQLQNDETVTVQLLTTLSNGIEELSRTVDTKTAAAFKAIIEHLQLIIKSLQPSQK